MNKTLYHWIIFSFAVCSFLSSRAESLQVQQITLLGAQKTHPWVILRELTFQQEEIVDADQLDQILQKSQQNIYNLGLFTEVKLIPQVNLGQLTVIISVKERWYIWGSPIFRLEERNNYDALLALWNLDLQRAVLGADLYWRNLTGRNETLTFNGLIGYKQRLGITFNRPAAFRKANIDLRVGISYRRQNETMIGTDSARIARARLETEPIEQAWSGVVGLQKRFSPYTNLELELNYQRRHFSDSLLSYRINDQPAGAVASPDAKAYYPTVKLSWVVDHRDVRSFPLSGYKYQLLARYTGPKVRNFSNLHMARFGASYAQHFPLTDRWNFAFGTQHLITLGDSIPVFEKSYIGVGIKDFGGTSTELRGYEPYSIGGTYVGMNKVELKYAIIPRQMVHLAWLPLRRFQDLPIGLYLTGFCDTGYVRDGSFSFQDRYMNDRWLVGYGLGLNVIGFYDMLVRIEYSRNHLGQGGIYLNGTVPIK